MEITKSRRNGINVYKSTKGESCREDEESTCASMPIHNNVACLHNGVKDDTKEVVILLTSPSPRLVAIHQLIALVREIAEHVVLPDRKSNVHLFLVLTKSESKVCARKDLDVELVALQGNG